MDVDDVVRGLKSGDLSLAAFKHEVDRLSHPSPEPAPAAGTKHRVTEDSGFELKVAQKLLRRL